MTKENNKRFTALYIEMMKRKYPNVPEHAIPRMKFTDNTTNNLTKCVVNFINYSGYQAERISNTGRYIDESRTVTDVLGQKRKIGSGKFIPGTGTNGTADISATIHGRSVKIEIKFGKDRQSEVQKKYQEQIEKAGGIYVIVKDFDSFLIWYNNLLDNII